MKFKMSHLLWSHYQREQWELH